MKIQFVCNGVLSDGYQITNVNPAYFFLKAYYHLHGLNPNLEWLENEWFMFDPLSVQLERIVSAKPDILACSVYVWNYDFQYELMRKVKEALPNCIVIAGGPQLAAHKHENFFEEYPYIDYVCYGDGEEAFQLLLDRITGYLPQDTVLYNIVENLHPGYKLHPLKILSDEKYLTTSPILIQKQDIINSINHIIERGIEKKNIQFALEFARGCMYACSFCDWSQNLTKKVKRRKHDWKADVDFFHEIDIAIRETDANFGQFKEDIEIFDYCLTLYDPNRDFKFHVHNTPKLKKEATFHIMLEMAKRFTNGVGISLQDIHEDVLNNIDRPSISWPDHIDLIKRFQDNLPENKKKNISVQIIIGIPGQTPERIADMVLELYQLGVNYFSAYNWIYLENSPAASTEYQEQFGIEWTEVWRPSEWKIPYNNLDQLFEDFHNKEVDPKKWYKVKILTKNSTMDMIDIMTSTHFIRRFLATAKCLPVQSPILLKKLKNNALKQCRIDVIENIQKQEKYYQKYGFYLYGMINDDHILIS